MVIFFIRAWMIYWKFDVEVALSSERDVIPFPHLEIHSPNCVFNFDQCLDKKCMKIKSI